MELTCKQCGKVFHRKKRTKNAKGHYFCSCSCAATFNSTGRPSKRKKTRAACIFCGKEVKKNATKYCGVQCQHDYQTQLTLSEWRAGTAGLETNGTVRRPIRRYLIDKAGNQCTICGWDKKNPSTGRVPLEVHHTDGNHNNNVESNLQVLCPNCHALTPSYRNLNKGGGRPCRRKA